MRSGALDTTALRCACPVGYAKVCEGSAAVLFPPPAPLRARTAGANNKGNDGNDDVSGDGACTANPTVSDAQAVFYNPAQVVNRDLSVCALTVFAQQERQRRTCKRQQRRADTDAAAEVTGESAVHGGCHDDEAKSNSNSNSTVSINSATIANDDSDDDGITVLEALSATGLRAIRYYKEVAHVRYIIANDMDVDAVACIRRNCLYNNVPILAPSLSANVARPAEHDSDEERASKMHNVTAQRRCSSGVIVNCDDANTLMHRLATVLPQSSPRLCLVSVANETSCVETQQQKQQQQQQHGDGDDEGRFVKPLDCDARTRLHALLQQEHMDVVDLDPYGSVAPFLDAALDVVKNGGLLLVTSTDSAVLCGNHVGTCHAKYTSVPYKRAHCHEMAVRIVLAAVERAASRRGKYIVPLLSLHIDFYVRCIVRVFAQPAEAKLAACKLGYYTQCTNCPAYWLRPVVVARPPRSKTGGQAEKAANTAPTQQPQQQRQEQQQWQEQQQQQPKQRRQRRRERDEVNGTTHVATPHYPTATYPASPVHPCEPRLSCPTLAQVLPVAFATCGADGDVGEPDDEVDNSNDNHQHGNCPVCGAAVVLAGPLYAATTQCPAFIQRMLDVIAVRTKSGVPFGAAARITGLLTTAAEELHDCPLYYEPQELSSYLHVRCPATACLVGALRRLGYRYSHVHCSASGMKTDCPPDVLVRIMLQWKLTTEQADMTHTIGKTTATTAAATTTTATIQRRSVIRLSVHCQRPLKAASFVYDRQYDDRRPVTGVKRFVSSEPGWGPRRRHRGALCTSEVSDRDALANDKNVEAKLQL